MSDKQMYYQGRPIAPDFNASSCPEKNVYYCSGGVCEAHAICPFDSIGPCIPAIYAERAELEEARAELAANSAMLARQCDLAREAETGRDALRAKLARVVEVGKNLDECISCDWDTAHGNDQYCAGCERPLRKKAWDAAVKEAAEVK
jgi:hypothetical protein